MASPEMRKKQRTLAAGCQESAAVGETGDSRFVSMEDFVETASRKEYLSEMPAITEAEANAVDGRSDFIAAGVSVASETVDSCTGRSPSSSVQGEKSGKAGDVAGDGQFISKTTEEEKVPTERTEAASVQPATGGGQHKASEEERQKHSSEASATASSPVVSVTTTAAAASDDAAAPAPPGVPEEENRVVVGKPQAPAAADSSDNGNSTLTAAEGLAYDTAVEVVVTAAAAVPAGTETGAPGGGHSDHEEPPEGVLREEQFAVRKIMKRMQWESLAQCSRRRVFLKKVIEDQRKRLDGHLDLEELELFSALYYNVKFLHCTYDRRLLERLKFYEPTICATQEARGTKAKNSDAHEIITG